jgi:hypothetical protein
MKTFKEYLTNAAESQSANLTEAFIFKSPLFRPDTNLLGNACFYKDSFFLIIEANRTPDELLFCMVDKDNNFKTYISPSFEKATSPYKVGSTLASKGADSIVVFKTGGMVAGALASIAEETINRRYRLPGLKLDDMMYSNHDKADGDFRTTWAPVVFSVDSLKGKDVLLKKREFTAIEIDLINKLAFVASKTVKFGKVSSDEIVYFSSNKIKTPTLFYAEFM